MVLVLRAVTAHTRLRHCSFNRLYSPYQRAKKVVSDSPRLVDFAIGLVDSDHHLPDGQVKFFGN